MTGILPDASDLLAQRAVNTRLGHAPGASSFFSKPSLTLDPHLFNGTHMLPDVRTWVLTTLYGFWERKYRNPPAWSQVWIAGSGVTYQWNAPRSVGEPGDLDVLVGVNFPTFWAANPSSQGIGEAAQAEWFNDQFRSDLDQRTNHQNLNGETYEVTFYVNPGATDIRDINPYAAYSVTRDEWTVTPPDLAPDWDPMRELPQQWWEFFESDEMFSNGLFRDFRSGAAMLKGEPMGSPRWINIATALHSVIKSGADLFDTIHTNRHKAFAPDGGGYTGFDNVRWQNAKRIGILHSLHQLKDLWTSAHANRAERCDGTVPLDAAHALTVAAMVGAAG